MLLKQPFPSPIHSMAGAYGRVWAKPCRYAPATSAPYLPGIKTGY